MTAAIALLEFTITRNFVSGPAVVSVYSVINIYIHNFYFCIVLMRGQRAGELKIEQWY